MAEKLLMGAGKSQGMNLFGNITGASQIEATAKANAKQSELAAKAEELKGRAQADKIRNALLSTLASQRAAFSARGLGLGSGTFKNVQAQSYTEANKDIEFTKFGAALNAEQLYGQAKQQKLEGKYGKYKAYTDFAFKMGSLIAGA